MLATENDKLASLGAYIRAARLRRGVNQIQTARDAGVSRKQLILLEKGGNVTVKFLLRVARYLELTTIPLDGNVQFVSGQEGQNVFEITRALDLLIALATHARNAAFEAMLPPSERRTLHDTSALREFVARHDGDAERLAALLVSLSESTAADSESTSPKLPEEHIPARAARRPRRRKGA